MRRSAFLFALPLVLPFLASATARADEPDPVKPATPVAPPAPPEAPKPGVPKPAAPATGPSAPAAPLIPFLTDYEAAKQRAAEEKKGLFVYLTPDWFT